MNNLPINLRRILVVAGIFFLALMVMDFNRRIETMNSLNDQVEQSQAQATRAVQTLEALQTQVAFAASTEAVNAWARAEGHYAQAGDQAVIPIGLPGSEPVTAIEPTPQPTPIENWQVWWNLFFND